MPDRVERRTGARSGLEIRPAPVGRSALVRAYLEGSPDLAPFYAGFPFDPDAYRRKADAVRDRLSAADRQRLAPALLGTSAAARAKITRVLAGDGLAVTTGQQAGLFGGPLYTIYKVLSAVRLAAELERLLGQPVSPIFWIASDDHDWAEVDHTFVVDNEHELQRVSVDQPPGAAPVPMSVRRLGDGIHAALDAFAEALPDSAFAGPLVDLLRDAYRPDATVGAAFRKLFGGLLAELDVVLLDSAHPDLKSAATGLLLHEIEHTSSHTELLRRQTARLEAAGFAAQVPITEGAANVFFHDEHGRERLTREGDRWVLRRTKREFGLAELRAWIERDPSSFSPGVLFRPVVESGLLPTVAYVGGPGEVAYFGQIGCLFRAHGIEPPLVVPRGNLTLVEPGVRRILDKFDMDPAAFERPFHELVTERIRASLPESVTAPLADLEAALRSGYDRLMAGAAGIDPTLEGWVRRIRNQALLQVSDAERKATSHLKKRSAIEVGQLRRAAANLGPGGTAQDRVLNVIPYLARYGPGLVHDLLDAIDMRVDRARPDWSGVVCDG